MDKCKLTNKNGKFVKSHIIPKALTRPRISGNKFVQLNIKDRGPKYVNRSDSWYDPKLTIRKGEDILSELDDHGITQLRKHGLIWSSKTSKIYLKLPNVEIIEFNNPQKMRLFFLSLLWRAAATDMKEFEDITLPENHLEELRKIITGESSDRRNLYPMTLVSIAPKGCVHNLGPIKQQIDLGDEGYGKKQIFRFYMDGLVIHFYIEDQGVSILNKPMEFDSPFFVGEEKHPVIIIEYAESFVCENFEKHLKGYIHHQMKA